MLSRLIDHISFYFTAPLFNHLLVPSAAKASAFSLQQILDGYLLAVPKNRRPVREIWRRKYGNDNWINGTKLFKPKHNITTCAECGSFHEFHTICRNCFNKVFAESRKIMEGIRNTWGREIIDKEVQIAYQGETVDKTSGKQIVELDRSRPLWFAPNLSQKSANLTSKPSTIAAREFEERVIRTVDDKKDSQ